MPNPTTPEQHRKAVDAARKAVTRARKADSPAKLIAAEARLQLAIEARDRGNANTPPRTLADLPEPGTVVGTASLTPDAAERLQADLAAGPVDEPSDGAHGVMPSPEQVAQAAGKAEQVRAEQAAAKPAKVARKADPRSEVGTTEWKAMRDAITTAWDKDKPAKAIKLVLAAKRAGVAWSAITTITRSPETRGLDRVSYEAFKASDMYRPLAKK